MNFQPILHAKVCIFDCPPANKRQTIKVYAHTTVADILGIMNLPPDGSSQIEGPNGDAFDVMDCPYQFLESGREVAVVRHPKAKPLDKAQVGVSWKA